MRSLHRLVRYQLQAKLKVPRTTNLKQNQERFEQFKKADATPRRERWSVPTAEGWRIGFADWRKGMRTKQTV